MPRLERSLLGKALILTGIDPSKSAGCLGLVTSDYRPQRSVYIYC